MAIIHRAQLHPTKLELLTGWLPGRRWYHGPATPTLTRLGGYRFDDPAGEVGVETLLVSAGDGVVCQVPLTYRGAPLDGHDEELIGTVEHSVLGRRWVYDGCGDPVYVAALAAAILAGAGQAEEMIEDDGRLQPRELTMGITATAADPDAGPQVELLSPGRDDDEVTTVETTAAILTVVRHPGPGAPEPGSVPALLGTWTGQMDPVVLALAAPR